MSVAAAEHKTRFAEREKAAFKFKIDNIEVLLHQKEGISRISYFLHKREKKIIMSRRSDSKTSKAENDSRNRLKNKVE